MPSSTPSPSDSWTPERAVSFAAATFGYICAVRSRDRKEAPPITLLLLESGGICPLLVGGTAEHRAAIIRQGVETFGARYVVSCLEAWIKDVTRETLPEIQARRAAGEKISEMEGRREIVMCVLDGPGLQRSWTAPVLPDGRVGPVEASPEKAQLVGTMANLSGRLGEN